MGRRPLHHWPRVRELKDGAVGIRGRVLPLRAWVWLHFLVRLTIWCIAAALALVGTVAWWSDGASVAWVEGWPSEFGWWGRRFLEKQCLARWPIHQDDFVLILLVVSFVLYQVNERLSRLISAAFLLLGGGWIMKKSFEIVVTPEHVTVRRRWLPDIKMERGDFSGGAVCVRVVEAEDYFTHLSMTALRENTTLFGIPRHPPAVVELLHGFRRHKLVLARWKDEAEAIALRCTEALLMTTDSPKQDSLAWMQNVVTLGR